MPIAVSDEKSDDFGTIWVIHRQGRGGWSKRQNDWSTWCPEENWLMEVKVLWSDNAFNEHEQIFEYYLYEAGLKVAQDLVKGIVMKTLILQQNPRIGQQETLLRNRAKEYRYLVCGNYKIIYWVEPSFVKIASVFDCRQNPEKMDTIDI